MLDYDYIDLKGNNFTLLVMYLHTTCIKKIEIALTKKIKKTPYFFNQKTPIVINMSKINHRINWFNLYQIISDSGLCIIGVCCCYDDKLKNIITRSGLPILTPGNVINKENFFNSQSSLNNSHTIPTTSKTQIVHTPVRSGQKIYARNKDLIIIANISTGAEVIADGNIHVYGVVRGRILAGASGDKKSQIFCTNLSSELVSIGGYYWLHDQIPQEFSGKAVRLYLKNNTLIIQNIL